MMRHNEYIVTISTQRGTDYRWDGMPTHRKIRKKEVKAHGLYLVVKLHGHGIIHDVDTALYKLPGQSGESSHTP